MKKKILLLSAFLGLATMAKAEYKPWNYNYVGMSLFAGENAADAYGESVDDRYMEFEGFHRYNLLDAYWFVDVFDIFNDSSSDMHNVKPSIYGEINPRISIDGLLGKDLSVWRFKEWFISYQYDFDNGDFGGGLQRHQIGLGADFRIEGFDYFRLNALARYHDEAYEEGTKTIEDEWDGYLLNAAYGRKLYDFASGWSLYYTGWVDYVIGANKSELKKDWNGNSIGKDSSLQWFNQLKVQKNSFGISYSYKINSDFTEVQGTKDNSSDSNQHVIGLHYTF